MTKTTKTTTTRTKRNPGETPIRVQPPAREVGSRGLIISLSRTKNRNGFPIGTKGAKELILSRDLSHGVSIFHSGQTERFRINAAFMDIQRHCLFAFLFLFYI